MPMKEFVKFVEFSLLAYWLGSGPANRILSGYSRDSGSKLCSVSGRVGLGQHPWVTGFESGSKLQAQFQHCRFLGEDV